LNITSRLKSLVKTVTVGLVLATAGNVISISKAIAADMYGFPNLNGKVIKLELSNGVRLNLPQSRAIDNYKLNSFVPDNTQDWQWKIIDDGFGVSFTRVNTNKAFTVSDLNTVNGTSIVAWEYQGHGRWIDWNPQPVGNGYYLIRLRNNLNQCLNIPGSQSNVWATTWACNANDPDQRFKIDIIGGVVNNTLILPPDLATPIGLTPAPASYMAETSLKPWEYPILDVPSQVYPNLNQQTGDLFCKGVLAIIKLNFTSGNPSGYPNAYGPVPNIIKAIGQTENRSYALDGREWRPFIAKYAWYHMNRKQCIVNQD
jgi:hypothetical protein